MSRDGAECGYFLIFSLNWGEQKHEIAKKCIGSRTIIIFNPIEKKNTMSKICGPPSFYLGGMYFQQDFKRKGVLTVTVLKGQLALMC